METQEHLKGSRCCFGESVNTLPTKDNMPKRVEHIDPTCILCSQEEESCCHLFLHCPVAKAIWYASCWEFKLDWHNITTCGGIANIVLNPPPPHKHSFNQGRSLACMPKWPTSWLKYGTAEIKLDFKVNKLISRSLYLRANTSSSNTPQCLPQSPPLHPINCSTCENLLHLDASRSM